MYAGGDEVKIKHSLILLIIFVIIIPCTLTIVTASYQCKKNALEFIQHNLSSTTSIRAESINAYFKQREANMEIIARMPQLSYLLEKKRADDDQRYEQYLSNINNTLSSRADNQPYVDEILCVNRYDIIVAASDTPSIGTLFKHVPNAHEIPKGEFLISTLMAEDGSVLSYLAYPVFSGNSFKGYMIAIINKNYFKSIVESDHLLKSEKIIILDAENNVITSNASYINQPMSQMPANNNLKEQWDKIKFRENPTGEINFQVKGKKQMGYYVHLEKIGVTVLACIDRNSVNDTIFGTTTFIAIAISAIGLFAMFVIILFVRNLLKPINGLLGVIEQIDAGDYNARFSHSGKSELSKIISAFNGLVDTLLKKNNDLKQVNMDIKMTTENIPGGFMRCKTDRDFEFMFVSDSYLKLLGCTREELNTVYNNKFINTLYEGDRARIQFEISDQIKTGNLLELEYRIVKKNGEIRWILDKSQRVTDETGNAYFYCILIDITSSKKAQEKLKQNDERFRIILEQSDNIIFEWDFKSDRLNYSPQWVEKFGYHPSTDNVLSVSFTEHAHPEDKKKLSSWLYGVYTGKGNNTSIEIRFVKSDGDYLWTRVRSSIIFDNSGNAVKAIFLISDINADKEEIARLTLEAHTDMLTGLYNKITTQSKIDQYITQMPDDEKCAFYIIDIDNFKQINDTMGHLFGDSVLKSVSQLLCELFPDPNIIGRIGGDEFIVFTNHLTSDDEIKERVSLLLKRLPGAVHGGDDKIKISASIGVALYPQHGTDFNSLYENSDSALYVAKDSGKNQYILYTDEQNGLSYVKTFEPIPNITENSAQTFADNFCKNVLSIIYEADNLLEGLKSVFAIVGRHYNVSRMYLFENSEDGLSCSNTIEWCNDEISSRKDILQNVLYSDLNMHHNNFDNQGIFYCNSIDDCGPDLYAAAGKLSIRALLHCGIYNNGEFKGFVGFDDCNSNRFWTKDEIEILSYISRIICVFLVKDKNIE